MNMKTTKFLAVLAVLAMAFASVAIIAPMTESDATTSTVTPDATLVDSNDITATTADGQTKYYYVDISAGNVTINVIAGDGTYKNAVYNIIVYGDETNTLTISVAGDLTFTKAFKVNVYSATGAIKDGSVTYTNSDAMEFSVADGTSSAGSAVFKAKTTEAFYMTQAPTGSLLSAYYQIGGAAKLHTLASGATAKIYAVDGYNVVTIPAALKGTWTISSAATATGATVSTMTIANADTNGVEMIITAATADAGIPTLAATSPVAKTTVTPTVGYLKFTFTTGTAISANGFSTANMASAGSGILYPTGFDGSVVTPYAYGNVSGVMDAGANDAELTTVSGNVTVKQTLTNAGVIDVPASRSVSLKLDKATVTLVKEPKDYVEANTAGVGDTVSGGTIDVKTGLFFMMTSSVTGTAVVNIMDGATVYSTDADATQTGTINIYGGVTGTAPTTVNNVLIGPTAYGELPVAATNAGNTIYGDYTKIHGTFDYDTTMSAMILDGNLEITNGATVTIIGYVGLNNNSITITNGKLVIAGTGFVFSGTTAPGADDNSIVIGAKGTLENNGVLGANLPVMIKAGNGEATQNGITGVTFKYAKVSNDTFIRLSGTAVASSETWAPEAPTLTSNASAQIAGSLTIGMGITYNPTESTLNASATLTTNGTFNVTTGFTMKNGSTLNVNGAFTGIVNIEVLEKIAAGETPTDFEKTVITGAETTTPDTKQTVTGFTLYSMRTSYVNDDGDLFYNQRAYVEGKLASSPVTGTGSASTTPTETFTIKGDLYIAEDDELTITTGKLVADTSAKLIVLGSLTAPVNYNDGTNPVNMVGVGYSVTTGTVTVYYFDDFEYAMSVIELADNKKITLYGDVTVTLASDVTVAANQWIATAGTENGIIVPEGIKMTVEKDGRVDNKAIASVSGILLVKAGGNCVPATNTYDVVSTDSDSNKMYCGLQTAIDMAEGEVTITLTNDKTSTNALASLTLKDGITLVVKSNLVIKKTLNVPEGSKLVVDESGSLVVGYDSEIKNRKAIIGGELDLTAVTTSSFNGNSSSNLLTITVSGILKYNNNVAFNDCDINAVSCTISGVKVYTTIDQAVAGGATSVTFYGKYVDLTASFEAPAMIVIAKGAEVVLGEIDISGKSTITSNGVLTAVISGIDGVLEVPTEIVVTEFTGKISETSKTTSAGLTEYTFAVSDMSAGSLAVSDGIMHIASNITINADETLAIAEGAILASDGDYTITNNGTFLNAGTISVLENGLVITSDEEAAFVVTGYILIADEAKLSFNDAVIAGDITVYGTLTTTGTVYLMGTITVYDDEEITGTFNINGNIVMGDAEELAAAAAIVGEFTLKADCYILAFEGALFDATGLKYTEIYINDELYATAYVKSGNVDMFEDIITDDIEIEDYDLPGITTYTNWYDAFGKKLSESTPSQKYIGNEAEIYFYGTLKTADITISWAKGLSLYINDVRMTGASVELAVGIYSVSATVDAGYACDNIAITFNGIAVPITKEGALITIAADDDGSVLAVTGDVYIPEPEPVTPEEKSEWTITTILLVILVILIAVMAVIVALRLNRS